jgi:predicted aspartyl protease
MDAARPVGDTPAMAFFPLLSLCALFLSLPAVQADERYAPLAQMPMEISDNGSPLIPAQVNRDGPFWFLLDTGATGTTIRPPLVEKLGLQKMAAQVSGLQSMGGSLSADLYRVESIHYGPLEALNILAPSFERPVSKSHQLHGVAGIDILRRYAVEFDFAARSIRLHDGFRGGRGWVRVPSRFNRSGYAFVPFSVNGVGGEGFIDTGAASTILNPMFGHALGFKAGGPGTHVTAYVGGVEGARIPLHATGKSRFAIGPVTLPERPANFADLPIFARLGPPGARTAILGSDILKNRRFVVDYPGKSVWFHND